MDMTKKVKMALTYADVTQAELAKGIGTSAPNITQRIKRGLFTVPDLEDIADVLGCEFECYFVFPDGTKI